MLLLTYIDRHTESNLLDISTQGHSFITLVVAFLLVSRVNMGLSRYNMARDYIGTMYRENRELVQGACIFSNTNHDESAKEWRHEVAYRSLVLLRSVMVIIDYPVDHVLPWDMPELNGAELEDVKNNIFLSPNNRRWAHGNRTEWEESMRVPVRLSYLLRKSIHSQNQRLKDPIQIGQENKLLGSVDSFMGGYYGMRKFLTTVSRLFFRTRMVFCLF